jgi:hypothetical protein
MLTDDPTHQTLDVTRPSATALQKSAR